MCKDINGKRSKRHFVRRGAQVDLMPIIRNAPGSVTLMNHPSQDVNPVDFADLLQEIITGLKYAPRLGSEVDRPEGASSYIQLSDTVTNKIVEALEIVIEGIKK